MLVDGLCLIGARENVPVMPYSDQFLPMQEAQVLLQLIAKCFILVGIGIEDLNRGRRTWHLSVSSAVLAIGSVCGMAQV